MPKVSKIQASFTGGQISKIGQGRVDVDRYDTCLEKCLNYIPSLQGPLIRRPGTKAVGRAKTPGQAPTLIPFQFNLTQNTILEFGNKYVRFYTNESAIVTNTTFFQVAGVYGPPYLQQQLPISFNPGFAFTGIRSTATPGLGEMIISSSVVPFSSSLELETPYNFQDVSTIKFTQKQDTLYLTHPNYPTSKIVRTGLNTWDLKQIPFQDGPYLPFNSYLSIADSAKTYLSFLGSSIPTVTTGPATTINSIVNTGGQIQVQANQHGFQNGDNVFISGVFGTTEANNVTSPGSFGVSYTNSSVNQAYWTAINVDSNHVTLAGSVFVNNYIGSGTIYPALFQLVSNSSVVSSWNDIQVGSSGVNRSLRNIGFEISGYRYWGYINGIQDAAHALVIMGPGQGLPVNVGSTAFWQLGVYNNILGFPGACTFHQDRLVLAGFPGIPQELDASMTGNYEVFSASGSNLQVNANNALQFSLNSQDLNTIRWIKSSSQGMFAGTQSNEWLVTPSDQTNALSPTNINAVQVSTYGSYNTDAILVGVAGLFVQRAQLKVRELLYFWQINNYRATDLAEITGSMSLPGIVKIVLQKETHTVVWALKADGNFLSLSYNRDDVTLRSGWAGHTLGGQSDKSGTPPIVSSIAVIPSSDTTWDELWFSVNRVINGTTVTTIEYMTKPFDDSTPQEMAYHFDCGGTYNNPIAVTNIAIGSSTVVTAPNHGMANSSTIRFYQTVGVNISYSDANGNVFSSSLLNEQTFVISSVTTNTFYIQDFLGNYINTNSASVYIGSAVVRQLVTSLTGINLLAGETVGIVADGGIVAGTTVSQSGQLTLPYPAAIVSYGYPYNSDGQMLRTKDGSAQGTSIGSTRRVSRVAFMLHNVGELQYGNNFLKLIPAEFSTADANNADKAPPLYDGVYRDGVESEYGFTDSICFRQNSGLPGMIQAVTRFLEEEDV